jgi:hypothetical protein
VHLLSSYPPGQWVITTEDVLAEPCDTCGRPVRVGEMLHIRLLWDEKKVRRYHLGCEHPPMATSRCGATISWDEPGVDWSEPGH